MKVRNEEENGLNAICLYGQIVVADSSGQIWWPDEEAEREIASSADPERTALDMVMSQPLRGIWHC